MRTKTDRRLRFRATWICSPSKRWISRVVSFRCIPGAVSFRTRWRQHRMPLFAVRIGNDRADEPFGLLAITIRWTQGQVVI